MRAFFLGNGLTDTKEVKIYLGLVFNLNTQYNRSNDRD